MRGAARRLPHGALVHGDPGRQIPHFAAQYGHAQAQVDVARTGAARRMSRSLKIAARSQARRGAPNVVRPDEHVGEARVQPELRELPSMRRDARGGIDRLELAQQIARLRQRRRGRRIEP